MSSLWTVVPRSIRKELEWEGHAFWVELKDRLNTGEAKELAAAAMWKWTPKVSAKDGESNKDDVMTIDWAQAAFAKVRIYLVAWSLTDEAGSALTLHIDTFKALDPGVFRLIEVAIDDHAKIVKNSKATGTATSTESPNKI